jgi:hypothetical protein
MKIDLADDFSYFFGNHQRKVTKGRFFEEETLIAKHFGRRFREKRDTRNKGRPAESSSTRRANLGLRAQAHGQALEVLPVGKRLRQVQHDTTHRGDDPRAKLQEALAENPDLGSGMIGARQP